MYNAVKNGNVYNYNYKKFVCDTIADMNDIETEKLAAGSSVIVLKADGGQKTYVLSNAKEWVQYSAPAGSGSVSGLGADDIASLEDTREYLGI